MIGPNGAMAAVAAAATAIARGERSGRENDRRRLSVVDDPRDFMIRDISREDR